MRMASKKDTKLISANSDAAGVVEVHEMTMEKDIMRMRAVDGLQLAAGKPLELKAGGYHLMMMDLKKQLKVGFEVQISEIGDEQHRTGSIYSLAKADPLPPLAARDAW